MGEKTNKQNNAIVSALEHISKTTSRNYSILSFPDEEERMLPACDMIVKIGDVLFAIEHTTIDSYVDQRKDDAWFSGLLVPLEEKLKGRLPPPGRYKFAIYPNSIPTNIDWAKLQENIRKWCLRVAPGLKLGSPQTAPHHFIEGIPKGIPFKITLSRWPSLRGRKDGEFQTWRYTPTDLENQRVKVICQALHLRGGKVSKYNEQGYRTMLIFESNDIALANESLIGHAFIEAMKNIGLHNLPDEIYLIMTDINPHFVFCLKKDSLMFPNIHD